jgi:competence protein ComEC
MFPEIGASVASATKKYYRVKTRSSLPAAAGANSAGIRRILHAALTRTAFVQVRDVGQASFATLLAADGSELAHYDAGWPISYNRHTAPSIPPVATKVPVILSHWDWDHLHAWHSVEELRSSCWIVPRQEVGPGAAKLAKALHAKKQLKVCGGKSVVVGASTLIRCSGGSGLNDTGLALGLALANGRRVLLIGDADYSFCALPAGWKGCDALIATHHGAMFHGAVPGPTNQNDLCVISVGYGNIYHHPFQAAVSLHKAVGWRVSRTSMHGKTARGDRMLS